MSMEDRDWYREESHQRRAQAESETRPGWNRAEEQGNREQEPIPLHLTPLRATLPLKPLGLVLVFGMLALNLIRGENGKVAWPPARLSSPSLTRDEGVVSFVFPENGSTILTARTSPVAAVPLTIQTSAADTGR